MLTTDDTKLEDAPAAQPLWQHRPRDRNRNLSFILIITIAITTTLTTVLTNSLFAFNIVYFPQRQPQQQPQRQGPPILVSPSLLKPYQVHTSSRFGPYITCPPLSSPPSVMLAAGCSFDLLANGWIPNPCFDSSMHAEFTRGKDYGFFEDINGTRRVHQDVIMRGDVSRWPTGLFVTFHEHFEHCRYILNGSVRAVQPPFTGVLDMFHDQEHLLHCLHVLRQKKEPSRIETYVKAVFTVHKCYLSLT